MAGVNRVTIIGNLGQDPEVRYMPQGGAVANLSVATSESWTDKQTNEKKEQTEWHKLVIYGRLAEIAGEYLRKGSKIYVEGKLRTRKWQDQQGVERYTTEIIVNEMQMLDGKNNGQGAAPQAGYNQAPQANQAPRNQPPQTGARPAQGQQQPYNQAPQQGYAGPHGGFNQPQPGPATDFDDEIPF